MVRQFSIHQRSSGRTASVTYPMLELDGDPELCSGLRPFLQAPWLVVRSGGETQSGLRSSVVTQLKPGSLDWLEEGLTRASEQLGLDLAEAWL